MTESTQLKIPVHLRKYIVDQNYDRYTAEDQAAWRFIMRQLRAFLSRHAHEIYTDGLAKTGITVERIPRIEDIDRHLEKFGWGAVPVSGFIPPAAFMEFQAIGVLPIASDMRTLSHLQYTPAPDIVHEAAGHAPILVHPEYAAYLRQYGEVARHALISKEDMDQYEAIRILSDIKEDPRSTPPEIARAEKRLAEVTAAMQGLSEAALLSRMNWWTAEYGLIGDLAQPRLFGAGLLSSVGESRECLSAKVKKIPLSVDCVNYAYDITEPQPQLFVARDFGHLTDVLEELAAQLSYRRGGRYGLERAIAAATVNTAQLNSGLQISGCLRNVLWEDSGRPAYLQFDGPSALAFAYRELEDQGPARHPHGFSSPVGFIKGERRCLSTFAPLDLERIGVRVGARVRLEFESGVVVDGKVGGWTYEGPRLLILTFEDCRVTRGGELLFDPAWGVYDMACGSVVESVFGGPADRERFGSLDEFANRRVPPRTFSPAEKKRFATFQDLRTLRESGKTGPGAIAEWRKHLSAFLAGPAEEWLPGVELLELSHRLGLSDDERAPLIARLDPARFQSENVRQSLSDGLALATQP